MAAWSLQKLSGGRFLLGLGTQVRAHVERRYGLAWSAPAPWIRDYVTALRALWDCWQHDTPLQVATGHYRMDLMVPLFDPGPIEHPRIPIHLAAIGPNMCAVAGEVADGIRLHPVCTTRFIDEQVLPAVATRRGPRPVATWATWRCASSRSSVPRPMPPRSRRWCATVRARVAFYLSTPSYRRAFEVHGWADVAARASVLSRQQRWEELPGLVDDEMLHTVATIGTYDEIADRLNERYADRVDRIEFSVPVHGPADADAFRAILAALR